MVKFKFI